MNVTAIKERVDRIRRYTIDKCTDPTQVVAEERRLYVDVLAAIADGTARNARACAIAALYAADIVDLGNHTPD